MSEAQVIAIDGPAASGKSSVAREVAKALGWLYVNTGNMYRAVSWLATQQGLSLRDAEALASLVQPMSLTFEVEGNAIKVIAHGRALTDAELNSQAVNEAVSLVAQVPDVRHHLVEAQRALVSHGSLVMEGRDIGSVVFPDSPFKFYIDASEEVRSARRASQGLTDTVAKRDQMDSSRKTAPLVIPQGAAYIDTSDMTLAEVVERVLAAVRKEPNQRQGA